MQLNHKTLLVSVGVIVLVLAGLYVGLNTSPSDERTSPSTSSNSTTETASEEVVSNNREVISPNPEPTLIEEVIELPAEEEEPAPTPTPAPAPTPLPTPVTPSGYTLTDVAKHADASSCWSIIGENVYDLTSFVPSHPGGEKNILRICGTNGTSLFQSKHGGESKPEKVLANFRVGAYRE